MSKTKYIFVTGGVTSSLGKGIIAASLGKLLQARGYRVTIQKLDPYINVDPGTLNPYEHGECFVTEDGAETDLDLGHYERFLNEFTSQGNNITTGRIYKTVIEKERHGDYLGKTVQIIPHVTDEIKRHVKTLGSKDNYDIVITEIGGTVGDMESLPFIESVRQLKWELGNDALVIHLTLVPYLAASGELKTKPTQHSVKELLENGVQPDVLVLRTEHELDLNLRKKVALFCNVDPSAVVQSIDAPTIYQVPLNMLKEKLDTTVLSKLRLQKRNEPELVAWNEFLDKMNNPKHEVQIGLVGKYVELHDAYKSIVEAVIHGATINQCKANIKWIHSEDLNDKNVTQTLKDCNGILVAPGFGDRGIEGKLLAVQYAREHKVPFLGICLGMQVAVVEFARNVLGFKDANTAEVSSKSANLVIDLMEGQKGITAKGGTMRLGKYSCKLKRGTNIYRAYGTSNISERHRHRYEFNDHYLELFEEAGMTASGKNDDTNLVEAMEVKDHPWFVGVQFHPEYKSTVINPHPLFKAFVGAIIKNKK
ncbi:MAG: CTP synthase [Bacteroidales bacterium]